MAAAAEPRSPERETSGHRARRWATANVTFPSLFGVLFVVAGAISAMFLPVHLPALMLTSDPCANLVRNAACAGALRENSPPLVSRQAQRKSTSLSGCGGLHSSCPRCPVGQSCAADNDCDRSMSANSSFGEVACSASTHLCTDRRTGMQAYTESDTAPTAVAVRRAGGALLTCRDPASSCATCCLHPPPLPRCSSTSTSEASTTS